MLPLVLAVLASTGSYYTPSEAQSLFNQSTAAYYKEDYASAEQGFEKLLDHGFGGPDVLYNLGTAELQKGELGPAILHLEQARRQGADSDDLEANLALARARQLDKVVGAQLDEPLSTRIAAAFPGRALGITFLIAWGLAFLLLIARRWLKARPRRWAGALSLLAFLIALPLAGLVAAKAFAQGNDREAVVLAKTAQVRAFPEDDAKVAFEVHEGLEVRLLDTAGAYVHIQLANGKDGWVEKSGVGQI